MEPERYKENLLLIQQGKTSSIDDEALDTILQHLTYEEGEDEYFNISILPDGSTFFREIVLDAVLLEKANRTAQGS